MVGEHRPADGVVLPGEADALEDQAAPECVEHHRQPRAHRDCGARTRDRQQRQRVARRNRFFEQQIKMLKIRPGISKSLARLLPDGARESAVPLQVHEMLAAEAGKNRGAWRRREIRAALA